MKESTKYLLYAGLIVAFLFYTARVYTLPAQGNIHTTQALEGKMIWQQKNCNACHQLYGLGGYLGPDLTNIYSDPNKGSEYIKAFVRAGTSSMPAFQLSDAEINSLLVFLQDVDACGKASPKTFKTNWNGTIERK